MVCLKKMTTFCFVRLLRVTLVISRGRADRDVESEAANSLRPFSYVF